MPEKQFSELDPLEVKKLVDEGKADLIDVRESHEWEKTRIPGAALVPLSQFDPHAMAGEAGKMAIFHCRSGTRTWNAQLFFKQTGYAEVAHLKGGILAWHASGLPIEGPETPQ